MKTKILTLTIFSLAIVGCNKQPETKAVSKFTAQVAEADKKIGLYFDVLDNPKTARVQQINVLCKQYPKVFENEYMPALIALEPDNYSEKGLLKDFKIVVQYYSRKLDIQCS
ncbi:MAG: hypothetical protein O2793_13805 [Proteobacteria bacterium]|nr:hypothetical protein [Pseudomonadota bacterium]MDA1254950.1 hypothetical protein [Pseudomonadota bacterium]